MIFPIKPEKFHTFRSFKNGSICFYTYNVNEVNKTLVSEIEKLEKQYLMLPILKLDWIEYKIYFEFYDDSECNRVALYDKGIAIEHYCPPDFISQLPKMFERCKKIYDHYIEISKFRAAQRLSKQIILKSPIRQPRCNPKKEILVNDIKKNIEKPPILDISTKDSNLNQNISLKHILTDNKKIKVINSDEYISQDDSSLIIKIGNKEVEEKKN